MNQAERFDPDPISIASLSVSVAAFVLQFVQFKKEQQSRNPYVQPMDRANRMTHLSQVETATEEVVSQLKKVNRTIERGVNDADQEFYDAPFGLGRSSLYLDSASSMQFCQELNFAYTKVGHLGLWVNHIIQQDPELALRLGAKIEGGLSQISETINSAMSHGGVNRTVLEGGRTALEALASAIEQEIRKSN